MEIVIEISKEDYDSIKYNTNKTGSDYLILNGKILPAGHGRLIDANRANDVARETKTDRDERIIRNFLTGLPTIIEAYGGDAE